jgi:hypothetical protein
VGTLPGRSIGGTRSALPAKAQAETMGANIPVVGLTETMPPVGTYQTWNLRLLDKLRSALMFAGS